MSQLPNISNGASNRVLKLKSQHFEKKLPDCSARLRVTTQEHYANFLSPEEMGDLGSSRLHSPDEARAKFIAASFA